MAAPEPETPPPRRRRIGLLALLIALAVLAFALHWVSRPERVARLILAQVGSALRLEITSSGASEYRLRGTPMLTIRDVVARKPGDATPLLRADRIRLELPWSTIRARGADLTVRRIELDAPQLDLPALQRWMATRPPSKQARLPTLTDGLRIVRGRVAGDGWHVEAIEADIPSFHPDRMVRARLLARFTTGELRVPFDVRAAMTRPAAGAGLGVVGNVTVLSPPWTMPMRARLSGRLHNGADGIGLDAMRLGADATYRNGDTDLAFTYGIAGPLRVFDGTLRVAPLGAVVYGSGAVPNLQGTGALAFGDSLSLQLDGTLSSWPRAWPALPSPLGESTSPLPFALDYRGRADLSATTALRLRRDTTRFDGSFKLPSILRWLDAFDSASPLPPLNGRLSSPKLDIAGATLEGVEVEFGEDQAP
ncbi:hypothetical protein [Lysobacter auxotrophicus]|uniref:AsmA family protein n=1 Tax=Lysobacter auxotrophicus TaxID=2992573 RepID=A0ABM8DFW2_9GAMM|nr:hypothetical protein [Lysobacter auxotrophicus]BDU17466.1 AsmA family protein [Lysobacter auxotrophicus]